MPFVSVMFQFLAILALVIIMGYACWAILSDKVNDGVFGRAIYSVIILASAAGLMHMFSGTYPQRTTIHLLLGIAALLVRRMFIHYFWDGIRSRYFFHMRHSRANNRASGRSKW